MKHSAIGPCVELSGVEFLAHFDVIRWGDVERLEFAIDDAGLRIKVNNGIWSAPFGTLTAKPAEATS